MSKSIEQMNEADYEAALRPIWQFLAKEDRQEASDVIFVFGGLDLAVPARAAELFVANLAPLILVSGNKGPLTSQHFTKPEAQVFGDLLKERGVPCNCVILEENASNTLENVRFGVARLKDAGVRLGSAILVSKPFLMRRCAATFERQFPLIRTYCCPPQGSLLQFCDRPRRAFAERLLTELRRLVDYSVAGHISSQEFPAEVSIAAKELEVKLGVQ